MNLKSIKYLTVAVPLIIFAYISFTMHNLCTFGVVIFALIIVPILEFMLPGNGGNFTDEEEEVVKNDPSYDYVLYAMIPILYGLLIFFLFAINEKGLTMLELAGRTLSMGVLTVSIGINVGHELGHRKKSYEKFMSKMLLLTTLQLHFFIEHNKGHHKRVATQEDPASARYGETVYVFWFRSSIMGYISAWKLEAQRLKKKGVSFLSIQNEMIRFEIIQLLFVAAIYFLFGFLSAIAFVISAIVAKLFFETINYIEHYGLQRKKKGSGFEKVLPVHSWNSNKDVGRTLLFELTRHSDHHYKASRKYQVLKHYENVPQMPAGYSAMILLSFIPPLWFYVMHQRINRFKNENSAAVNLA